MAEEGWLAKSLFFSSQDVDNPIIRGFSNGRHYEELLKIGETLRDLYENNKYDEMYALDADELNLVVTSKQIYQGNEHTQRENFEKFVEDIFNED